MWIRWILPLLLLSTAAFADGILLDKIMSPADQQRTGISNLTPAQKGELEAWLNKNCTMNQAPSAPTSSSATLYVQIISQDGEELQLSDNSTWVVNPNDAARAQVWIGGTPILIKPSNDPAYPALLVNPNDGTSVKAKKGIAPSS